MAKSALEKFRSAPELYVQVLDKAMPWAAKGAKMVISSPPEIDRIIRRVPKGKVIRFEDLRQIISRKHQADVTCLLTAGLFEHWRSSGKWLENKMRFPGGEP